MAVAKPRKGESLGFCSQPDGYEQITLTDPEKVIWNSIRHLCSARYAAVVLEEAHGISQRKTREEIAWSLNLYIQQAFQFYRAAEGTDYRTAPLIYYYSFLNLAKALIEIKNPKFHQRPENYLHGISWRPNPDYMVNPYHDKVHTTTSRGVWHALWETIADAQFIASSPVYMSIRDLFGLCPEISIEFEEIFLEESQLLEVYEPSFFSDRDKEDIWIRFSVDREDLRKFKLTRPKLLAMISGHDFSYRQVQSNDTDLWTFESKDCRKYREGDNAIKLFKKELAAFNLFTTLHYGEVHYILPIQRRFSLCVPQLLVLYTIFYWLGSLVRYDPHSISELQESGFWRLIDGFVNQSRIWLLEQFEWNFYKRETTLKSAR